MTARPEFHPDHLLRGVQLARERGHHDVADALVHLHVTALRLHAEGVVEVVTTILPTGARVWVRLAPRGTRPVAVAILPAWKRRGKRAARKVG